MISFQEIQKLLPGVRENEPLKNYTWFKIGGPARFLYRASDEAALVSGLQTAERLKLPLLVLGQGANILVADRGFDGLVVIDQNRTLEFDGTQVAAGSGLPTKELLEQCVQNGLAGMEFMAGIPGTVGAAVYGNAGAWGHGFGELCGSVRCYRNGRIETLGSKSLTFAYRTSVFREQPGVVLSAELRLALGQPAEIAAEVRKILAQRALRIPSEPSAGSVFKNIELDATPVDVPRLLKALDITEDEYRDNTKYGKLPVGFLSERLNFRGLRIGGAQVSAVHGNIIVNANGTATADDVMQLVAVMKTRVRNQLGIQLHEEVQFVGF